MGVAECRTWKQLVLPGEHAEEIVARVRAEKRQQTKPWQVNATRPRVVFSTEKKRYSSNKSQDTKTQSVRVGMASGQPHASKLYSFKDKHVVSLFKLL